MANNISRSDLVSELSEEFNDVNGLSKSLLARIVSSYEDKIVDHVVAGDRVSLFGFIKLESAVRGARKARNPQTGEMIEVPERTVPRLSAMKRFKDLVAKK